MNQAEALVLLEPRILERQQFEIPKVTADTGILRIEACGLCGTDHEQYSGHLRVDFSFIPGHEIVGIVEDIGKDAAALWGVSMGDRVAVEVFRSCRSCQACIRGEYRRCSQNGLRTMFGFVDSQVSPSLWGGYASHLHLPYDAMLLPIPKGLDPILATIFNPLGAGIRWGATVPQTGDGDVVLVLGPGIRGLCVAVAAKEAGAGFVAMTGLGPGDIPRLQIAEQFGVDLTIDISKEDPAASLKRATGGLADIVVDVTAKAPAAFAQAVSAARPGGKIVVAGTRGGGGTPGFDPDHVVYKELTIIGSLGVDYPAYSEAIDILSSGRWPFETLTRSVVGYDELPNLLEVLSGSTNQIPPMHGVFTPTPTDRTKP